ncbi:MAG: hypothetical protein EYC62_02285 [Alphaproteobacteria bacterium]|nr:MAG: hypothetical protein EYC62_02285 [Alphaproteobacteria bacterium]
MQTASWAVIALRNSEKQEQQIKAAQIILAGAEKLIAPVAPNTPITTDTLNLKLAMSLYLAVTNNTPPEEQYYYLGIHNFRRVAETMLQQSRTDFATTMVELSHGCDNNPAALELATEYLQRAVHHIITGNPETALGIIPQLRDRNQAMRHERTSFRTPPSDSIDLQLSALEMLATAVVQHRQAASRTPR